MNRKPSGRISGALSAFESTIQKNEQEGGANAGMYLAGRFAKRDGANNLRQSIARNKSTVQERKALEELDKPAKSQERTPWKSSNLALINSDLARKIRAEASELEPAWNGIDQDVGTHVWRIEQFKVVAWPRNQYGEFHTGDSYIVLNSYKRGDSDALYHDVHIW